MVVLLLFNSADRLSYREIQAATAIAPAELKRSLQSLACVKVMSVSPVAQLAQLTIAINNTTKSEQLILCGRMYILTTTFARVLCI